MESFCFIFHCDDSDRPHKIYLERSFIKDRMNNICKRLLGIDAGDELTTKTPLQDDQGNYLIFYDLNIKFDDFNNLIKF